eukprot:gb/GECG01006909.1/.p1 GENE.gb/GECG01006909.1/~~gb/GECG01006909.1/.p1  ORF type:complete len:110 (+),score=6.73 gb/GECG01006909.1/:1-330(+)
MLGRTIQPSTKRVWVSKDAGVWPLLGVVTLGCVWASYVSAKYLTSCPDVHCSRDIRSKEIIRHERGEQDKWVNRWHSWYPKNMSNVRNISLLSFKWKNEDRDVASQNNR